MSGATDLSQILRTLTVSRRPGTFVFTTLPHSPPPGPGIEAVLREEEGYAVVCTAVTAQKAGWIAEFPAAWLTLGIHSALDAVGLTARVAQCLAEADIPCNVLAGFYHDHLLVPDNRVDEALDHLLALRED